MCGIFGVVSKKRTNLGELLTIGGRGLSYRGYDSVGVAVVSGEKIELRKDVGRIEAVAKRLKFPQMKGDRGIIQLRWATFGAPSQVNAQPHFGCREDIVGAHNGNIVNNVVLREEFLKQGHTVRSTNDGESCVHAFERFYSQGDSPLKAAQKCYNVLKGDYSYLITPNNVNEIYAVKNGSGLVIGLGEGKNFISSDLPSLLPFTNRIVRVKDGEFVLLTPTKVTLFNLDNGVEVSRVPETVEATSKNAEKEGFPHFFLKEIFEQPKVAADLLHLLKDSPYVDPFVSKIKKAKNVFLVGSGTSFHAALLGSYYLSKISKKTAIAALGPELIEQYGHSLNKDTACVFISQSGETKDVIKALKFARSKGAAILGIVNVIGSSLMYESDYYLPLTCGYEISVPATKTFLNQVLLLLYLSYVYARKSTRGLFEVPALLEETLKVTEEKAKAVAQKFIKKSDLYYEGYGITYPIAKEGALKLKEVTYAHCEAIFSSEFKHGPLSAVSKGFPVVFISGPADSKAIVNHINEVSCRGGLTVSISEPDPLLEKSVDLKVDIPDGKKSNDYIFPLLAVIPLQLIAYYWSTLLGIDPDFPRNLSKTLTVD